MPQSLLFILVSFMAFSLTHSFETMLQCIVGIWGLYLFARHIGQIDAYIKMPHLLFGDIWQKLHPAGQFILAFASVLFLNPAFMGVPLFALTPLALFNCLIGVIVFLSAMRLVQRFLEELPSIHGIYKVPTILVPPIIKRYENFIAWPIASLCGAVVFAIFALFYPMGFGVALFAEFVAIWVVITVLMVFLHIASKFSNMRYNHAAL